MAPDQIFSNFVTRAQLGFFLALVAGATVFLIALAYSQIVTLFPAGGGGSRIASKLLGRRASLIVGLALFLN